MASTIWQVISCTYKLNYLWKSPNISLRLSKIHKGVWVTWIYLQKFLVYLSLLRFHAHQNTISIYMVRVQPQLKWGGARRVMYYLFLVNNCCQWFHRITINQNVKSYQITFFVPVNKVQKVFTNEYFFPSKKWNRIQNMPSKATLRGLIKRQ